MGIRTVEQYKESLKDGRRVYIRGEKVADVTRHPVLGVTVDTVAQGFALTSHPDPEIRDLLDRIGQSAGGRDSRAARRTAAVAR